jgi:hypothetical protein
MLNLDEHGLVLGVLEANLVGDGEESNEFVDVDQVVAVDVDFFHQVVDLNVRENDAQTD